MTASTLHHVAPGDLVESTTNPRKGRVEVSDLVESVKAQGVLEPLLGRPTADGRIEIVFGRRRRAAALAAGLPAVPVLVRDMSDAEALEAQIVENRDRRDVHPMEEAEAYEALLKLRAGSVEDVAARVGVTVAYLSRRLALLKLAPEVREVFAAGRLETSVALILAPLRTADQVAALTAIAASEDGRTAATPYRAALDYIRRTYLLRLSDAPFSIVSADLIPGAGPCGACPKRTGSNPNLFGEFENTELCTDPACHAKKVAAGWARLRAAAEGIGREVLDDKAAAAVFKHGASTPVDGSGYVDLDEKCDGDRTYREVLGTEIPPPTLARDSRGGVHDLLTAKEARKALAAAQPKKAAEPDDGEAEAKIRRNVYRAACEAFRPLAKNFPVRIAVEALIGHAPATRKAWKLDPAGAALAALKGADLCALALEASMECVGALDAYVSEQDGPLVAVARAYGVDLDEIRKEIASDV